MSYSYVATPACSHQYGEEATCSRLTSQLYAAVSMSNSGAHMTTGVVPDEDYDSTILF
jgi:protein-disulfide isomerase-like protein with CxxC motif